MLKKNRWFCISVLEVNIFSVLWLQLLWLVVMQWLLLLLQWLCVCDCYVCGLNISLVLVLKLLLFEWVIVLMMLLVLCLNFIEQLLVLIWNFWQNENGIDEKLIWLQKLVMFRLLMQMVFLVIDELLKEMFCLFSDFLFFIVFGVSSVIVVMLWFIGRCDSFLWVMLVVDLVDFIFIIDIICGVCILMVFRVLIVFSGMLIVVVLLRLIVIWLMWLVFLLGRFIFILQVLIGSSGMWQLLLVLVCMECMKFVVGLCMVIVVLVGIWLVLLISWLFIELFCVNVLGVIMFRYVLRVMYNVVCLML